MQRRFEILEHRVRYAVYQFEMNAGELIMMGYIEFYAPVTVAHCRRVIPEAIFTKYEGLPLDICSPNRFRISGPFEYGKFELDCDTRWENTRDKVDSWFRVKNQNIEEELSKIKIQ